MDSISVVSLVGANGAVNILSFHDEVISYTIKIIIPSSFIIVVSCSRKKIYYDQPVKIKVLLRIRY